MQAAGVIHSDFERGFIKAEVVAYDDMIALGSFAAARVKGALRPEGKDYIVQEGDVILFWFNVQECDLHHNPRYISGLSLPVESLRQGT